MEKTFQELVDEAMASVTLLTPEELQQRMKQDSSLVVIDVRGADDIASTGTIPNAINISLDTLRDKNPEDWSDGQFSDQSRAILTTCAQGPMGTIAGKVLQDKGFTKVVVLSGGVQAWKDAGFQTSQLD